MQHKRGTKHSFFRLKQMTPAIQNRITGVICLNARKLNMFYPTLNYRSFFNTSKVKFLYTTIRVMLSKAHYLC